VFYVDIQLTDAYPFEPPKMRFMTKVWHPNVSSANGAICLDILKEQWSPALSIKTAMLSLQALLSSPEPSDPQDAVVARQYMDDLEEFNAQAKRWTEEYAAAGAKDEKLERLKEMGFAENAVRAALGRAAGDEQQALELLLTGI
jgi:ubiquitin-conjugating enzyme (huntingtin interacting protein 2)